MNYPIPPYPRRLRSQNFALTRNNLTGRCVVEVNRLLEVGKRFGVVFGCIDLCV